jgi:MFS family permease
MMRAVASRLSALRSRDFRLLFFGQLVSLTGSAMQQVAVAWQLYVLTRSPLALGTLGLARALPVVVFALGGGVFADALDRRKLMLLSQTGMALASVILAALTHAGRASPTAIYLAVALSGIAFSLDSPARQALIPRLVPVEDLPNALSLHATAWQLAQVLGPAIAGIAIDRIGLLPIYIADVASFVAVIGALLVMQHRAPPQKSGISIGAAIEGVRFLYRTPVVLWTMLLDAVATFFAGSLLLMPIYADQILGVGARGLGWLYAATPVGAAIAATFVSLRPTIRRQGPVVLTSVALYGLTIAVFGVSRWLWLSLLMLAASGAADTVSMVVRQTIRQLATPDELRGRMTSVNMIFFIGGPQLGEFEAGVVARLFGARFSVASGGVACALAVAAMALAIPRLRTLSYRASEPTRRRPGSARPAAGTRTRAAGRRARCLRSRSRPDRRRG